MCVCCVTRYELTDKEQSALQTLGYTEGSWDFRKPETNSMHWDQLSATEQAAAEEFGYTKTSWDNLSGKEPQPELRNARWDSLAGKKKNALKVLGWRNS